MFNPHQEIIEKLELLNSRIANLEGLIVILKESEPLNQPKEILFTVKQLAEYWQCHEQTIHKKKKAGELDFIQHGRKLLFRKSEIDKMTTVSLSKKGR